MINLNIKIDRTVYDKKMSALEMKLIPFIKTTGMKLAEYGFNEIRNKTPNEKIKQLWKMTHRTKATEVVYTIYNKYPKEKVVLWMEEGTKPHMIRPVRTKCLHFILERSGEEIFTMRTAHPGTPAHQMVESTRADLEDKKIPEWKELVYKEKQKLMSEGVK